MQELQEEMEGLSFQRQKQTVLFHCMQKSILSHRTNVQELRKSIYNMQKHPEVQCNGKLLLKAMLYCKNDDGVD